MDSLPKPVRSSDGYRLPVAAIVAPLVVAVVTFSVTVLAYYVVSAASPETLGQLAEFFWPASVLLFLLLTIGAALGGLWRWYWALLIAVVAAVVAAYVGALAGALLLSAQFDGLAVFLYAAESLIGPHLIFTVVAVLTAMMLGRRVWSWLSGRALDAPGPREATLALVRLPATNLDEGLVTHIARSVIDTELADAQWDSYVAALAAHGWDVVEVPVAPDAADSVFIEDTVVIFGDTAVITRPGAESRRAEPDAVEASVSQLGLTVERITEPGTLDGGDVLKIASTVYVGRGGRTNAEGIRQLRSIVSPLGYTVVAVPVSKVLHLKSAVTALPDGTVIGFRPNVDDPNVFDRFMAMPEESGSAVVVLDEATVLMADSAPRSAELIRDLGYSVVTVDISEFEKLEGCVTCLSVRIR
ncbi:MAG TPA: dimethylarginine dimethylaminohydrolase [Terrimesophilobacter sp.]|nr:dimethylarginine dimethylaminohydrolase [Terrimesophilobacter sp.]